LDQTKLTRSLVVLTFLPHYLPGYKAGGVIRSIANMVSHISKDFQFKIFTSDRDFHDTQHYRGICVKEWNRVGNAMVYYCPPLSLSLFAVFKILSETEYDILYLNSFFSPKFSILPLLLRWLKLVPRKPTILAPRGELAPGALKLKAWKKKPYMFAAKLLELYSRITWHASTLDEKTEIIDNVTNVRRVILAEQIFVAEDLLTIHPHLPERTGSKHRGRLNIVFLSRICRKKNLELALDVLSKVKERRISFHIYGPLEDLRYWRKCQQMVGRLPENVKAEYKGVVKNTEVIEVLKKYNLFFFPTFGESFGHVIWEAMLAGCPVLVSDCTPWRNLRELGVGWDVPLPELHSFCEIIENCADMDQEEHLSWSMRAREYALSKMHSTEAVERNINLFRTALLNGDYTG
jgi:glycosyltransferase involved in cell wall biosynthesis